MSGAQPWRVGLDVLVQHLPLGVFITSRTGAVLYVSDRCAEMIGAERDPSGGWAWVDRIHPDDRERVVAAWAENLGGDSLDVNYRVVCDGRPFAGSTCTPIPWSNSGDVQAIIGTVEDITDLRELHQKWGDRQLMLDAVLSNSSDLVVVVDPAGTLSFVSQAADRILGPRPAVLARSGRLRPAAPRRHRTRRRGPGGQRRHRTGGQGSDGAPGAARGRRMA